MTLGMHGAAVPLPHVPLWHARGQLYQYPNTVCLVRSSSIRKTGHAYKFFTGKSEGKRPGANLGLGRLGSCLGR